MTRVGWVNSFEVRVRLSLRAACASWDWSFTPQSPQSHPSLLPHSSRPPPSQTLAALASVLHPPSLVRACCATTPLIPPLLRGASHRLPRPNDCRFTSPQPHGDGRTAIHSPAAPWEDGVWWCPKSVPRRPPATKNGAGLFSPRFWSAVELAGWDEEFVLLAALVIEDSPVRKSRPSSIGLQERWPARGSVFCYLTKPPAQVLILGLPHPHVASV